MRPSLVIFAMCAVSCSGRAQKLNGDSALAIVSGHASPHVRASLAKLGGVPRIAVTLPVHVDEPMIVRDVGDERVSLSIVAEERDSEIVVTSDAVRAEELRVYRTPANIHASWRISTGSSIATMRARDARIEALDATGVVRLSTTPIVAYDALGIARTARVEVVAHDGGWIARATVNAADMRAPIVLDPAWSTVSSMSSPRLGHALLRLPSGKVLAIGGNDTSGAAYSTAEMFDPSTKMWSAAGAMGTKRSGPVAAVLPSGKVLVAGGNDGVAALSTAEVWDPATKTFTSTAAMSEVRTGASGVALLSGKVLVVSGVDGVMAPRNASTTAETYEEATAKWSSAGTLTRHDGQAAVRLASGKVLLVGGLGSEHVSEIYDPSTSSWSATAAVADERNGSALVALGSGALIAGGVGVSSAELFDPVKMTWSYAPSMSTVHFDSAGCASGSGSVLVAGGANGFGVDMLGSSAERFDAKTRTWRPAGSLLEGAHSSACTTLADGRVLLAGGGNTHGAVAYAQLFAELADGTPCTEAGECASGACTSGACGTSVPDAGVPEGGVAEGGIVDAEAPPALGGDFTRCLDDVQCSTGHCVDGVCCDTACTDKCHTCVLPATPGKCVPSPRGVDFRGECGVAASCSGTCDGSGGCTTATAGSQCAPSKCLGPAQGVGPAVCAAAGTACDAHAVVAFDCGNYVCEPAFGACRTSCNDTSDCVGGTVCDVSSKTCNVPPPEGSGGCGTSRRAPGSGVALLALLMLRIRQIRRN